MSIDSRLMVQNVFRLPEDFKTSDRVGTVLQCLDSQVYDGIMNECRGERQPLQSSAFERLSPVGRPQSYRAWVVIPTNSKAAESWAVYYRKLFARRNQRRLTLIHLAAYQNGRMAGN